MSAVRFGLAGAALVLVAGSTAAIAGSRNASFPVTAAIVNGCTVATDAAGRWGTISLGTVAGAGNQSASGTLLSGGVAGLQLNCTPGATVNVTADTGDHALGGQRRLAGGGAATIPYTLYANGTGVAWTTQPMTLSFPAGVSARTLPVAAMAAIASPVPAGTYTDTVRITLTF